MIPTVCRFEPPGIPKQYTQARVVLVLRHLGAAFNFLEDPALIESQNSPDAPGLVEFPPGIELDDLSKPLLAFIPLPKFGSSPCSIQWLRATAGVASAPTSR